MSMVLNTGNGERDLLAGIGPRSLFFGACAALFAPPLQAPPNRAEISVTAQAPPAGAATFGNASRLALGFPPLDPGLPRKTIVVAAAVPPAGAGWVSHQSPTLFPALAAPALRGAQVTPTWIPPPIPAVVFGATEHTKDQRLSETIVARPEFRPQEFQPLHFSMPVQLVPPLQPPRARVISVPQQLPEFVTSDVFWRSGAIPTSFATAPTPTTTTGFAVTPAAAMTVQGLPGDWLQFRDEGIDLGDPNVTVVDFVGDPAVILATRGVGENSHVITVALVPPVSLVPGWNTTNESGVWTFTNSDFTGQAT